MEKLLDEAWVYTLYQDNDKLILSTLCGTVALFERTIVLSPDETARYRRSGKAFIDQLAAKIRNAPDDFADRHVAVDLS